MTGRRDELAYIDATLPTAEVLAGEFSDFDCEASLKRIARLAVSRATDKMDHRARMAKAQCPRLRSDDRGSKGAQPVYRQAAAALEEMSSKVVHDPDTVDAMAQLVDDSRIEPAGALTFACLLYLSDRHEGAQFWWQFAAGAGVASAAYCLHLHHAQYSEDRMAEFWYRQAFMLHQGADDDHPDLNIGPPTPLSLDHRTPTPDATAATQRSQREDETAEPTTEAANMYNWALDHAKLADAVCRLEEETHEDLGLVTRPDPTLAAELEEHFA